MPDEPRPRGLLQGLGCSGTMLGEMPVLKLRAPVCIHVVAMQAPADHVAGSVAGAPALAVGSYRLPLLELANELGVRAASSRIRYAALKLGGVLGTGAKLNGALAVVVALHREAANAFAVFAALPIVPLGIAKVPVHQLPPSVFFRQKDRCCRAVGFADDPDSCAGSQRVGRQQPEAVRQRKFVFSAVIFGQIAPITSGVPCEECTRLFTSLLQRREGTRRGDELAEFKFCRWHLTARLLGTVTDVVISHHSMPAANRSLHGRLADGTLVGESADSRTNRQTDARLIECFFAT